MINGLIKNKQTETVFEKNHKIKYNEKGYFVKNKKSFFQKRHSKMVTVITPVFNAEQNLVKTIESVINQSIGFDNIEYILVDDKSTDASREILYDYATKFKNIMTVFLKENTGTPAKPRNLGIELSSSKYITFLDADDWFEQDAIKTMFDILESSNDDYIVGKTIEVASNGSKVIAEHESCLERRNVSPYSIPHIFQHLGPRARMIRSNIIKDNEIKFPPMKFAEDKQFFIDVITHCKSISTTKKVIYYLNRLNDNNASLTKQTNIFEKMDANIKVIKYVKNKNLPIKVEKMILNRLYEFDSITRLFNRYHFLKSDKKQLYYNKFNEVLQTTKELNYDISDNFFHPINKVAYNLFCSARFDDLVKLFNWDKKEKVKYIVIKDNLPYVVSPFSEEKYKFIRIPMAAIFENDYFEDNVYILEIKIYGNYLNNVTDVILRNRDEIDEDISLNVYLDKKGNAKLTIDFDLLEKLSSSSYAMFLRYNDYQKVSIRRLIEKRIKYKNRQFKFYTTINSNLGINIH